MTYADRPKGRNDTLFACYAVDAVRDALASGRFQGISPDDPMVAALLAILERIDWSASAKALIEALPHAPAAFCLHDLRSTLSRLGVTSRVLEKRWRARSGLTFPALIVTDEGTVWLLVEGKNTKAQLVDPVTNRPVKRRIPRSATILVFNKSSPRNSRWFVYDLFRRGQSVFLALLGVKLVINLVTVLATLSVFAIFSNVTATGAIDTLIAIGLGMAGAFILDFVYRLGKAKLLARLSARLEFLISSLAFRQVVSLPLEKLIGGTVAEQLARLRPLNAMASSIAVPLIDALTDIPFSILLTIVLFFLAGPIGALPLAVFAVFGLGFFLLMPGIRRLEDEARQVSEKHAQIISDLIENADDISLSHNAETWAQRAKHAVKRRAAAQRKAEVAARNLSMIGAMATPLVGGGTAIAGAALAMSGSLSSGGLIAAMILSWRIIAPMQTLLLLVSKWSDMFRLSGQLNRLMNMPLETDKPETGFLPELAGDVTFSGVAHRYNSVDDWSLRGVNVTVPKGTFAAVTGPSGSGKSTFLRMIPCLVQPTTGTVAIDGLNIRQIPISHLRANVSYVPFNPILIHGTIGQNLALGAPLISEVDITEVLEEVGLGDFVRALPEGIHTRLSAEVQSEFPKGFGQALAIAQALVRRPKVLLLDEPARSLDPALERAMMQALLRRRGHMTTVMVTHRPSHIAAADMQIDLQAGAVKNTVVARKEAS